MMGSVGGRAMEIKPIKGSLDFSERQRKESLERIESDTRHELDDSDFDALPVLPAVAGVVGGLIVLGWQIYTWLYSDVWISPSAYVVLVEIFGHPYDFKWLAVPSNWLGLHRILHWCVVQLYIMPLSWFVVLVGFILMGMMIPVSYILWLVFGSR